MPELAEVEYYRKQWDCGLGGCIMTVKLHAETRVFRGTVPLALKKALPGSELLHSEAHGKQMLFRFSNECWLGLHLGMTGELRVEPVDFQPGRHEHLVLYQAERALVFSDPRQFGRIRFSRHAQAPEWWINLPAPLTSGEFTLTQMGTFLERHRKLAIKPALLLQNGFPGLGNWMVDEILWRSGLDPHTPAGDLTGKARQNLWRTIRFVCRQSLRIVGQDYSELPAGWLFHQRWDRNGHCPRHGSTLARGTVGGRTTVWCGRCQPPCD
jgi:formamidopyrimidine-DNA glycosylase